MMMLDLAQTFLNIVFIIDVALKQYFKEVKLCWDIKHIPSFTLKTFFKPLLGKFKQTAAQ